MGIVFWGLFIVQVIIFIIALQTIFKVEKDRPTYTINPLTQEEANVL